MGIPATGQVVLVPLPFSDLSRTKMRPAVVLAESNHDDWILCQVTSNPYGDSRSISLDIQILARAACVLSVMPGQENYSQPTRV